MNKGYDNNDYQWIKELMEYPGTLEKRLGFFDTTADIELPKDPIERVIFQARAKTAIRKIAQNRGHILMVGKPGTGKSLLAEMFRQVLDNSLGDYLRPSKAIVAFPGKDDNHIRIAYEEPTVIDAIVSRLRQEIETARNTAPKFSLSTQINAARRMKHWLVAGTVISALAGLVFPQAFIFTGITGIGALFMFMQENNHGAQEKIQQVSVHSRSVKLKQISDQVPEVLYDPRKEGNLMARISEPDSRNMKGGFRHDPYQSANLQTPPHQRAYLGAHAKAPIIHIDELKTLIRAGYMSDMLEIMQNRFYILEGGRNSGSGSADRSEDPIKAENIILACCNHDTLAYLQQEGEGAFLSRIEDKGEIIQMESAVAEDAGTIRQVAQYVKQEIRQLAKEFDLSWGDVLEREGYAGIRKRSEIIMGRPLSKDFKLKEREFSKKAVLEIVKELRCRGYDGKLSCILRPINGIIKAAEFSAILENSPLVEPRHVVAALEEHQGIEGEISREITDHKKSLKKYIDTMTDSIGYAIGLAVISSKASGRMYGQPLPIHGQINIGNKDSVLTSGRTGEIAKAAAQNVRASIKKVLKKINAPNLGFEMHVEYIQAHDGVEGDSASVAMDIALVSDYIKHPVNQKFAITGSLTGDIILSVGGVAEKVRSVMDPGLGMEGACIPWQNKHDIEPLLINREIDFVEKNTVPGIRIYREAEHQAPFDIYFCKDKYSAYEIVMDLDREQVEELMIQRSKKDLAFMRTGS
ncbi:MAG: hypothetical protein GY737_32035 [Desulfobacteraceae bacterium]|nr:hypothetical protein [Desulfobacteraceae bacterium]